MDATPSQRLLEEAGKLRNDVAAAELIARLQAAGIRSILLKGPSIARWLYDEHESRPYGDVDLLVSPHQFDAAEAVAENLGFRHLDLDTSGEDSHHESWYRELDGVCVELHRRYAGADTSDQALWDELARHTDGLPLEVNGVTAEILDEPARALLVGLHAAAHGPAPSTAIADLSRAVDRLPRKTWAEAADLARRVGAEGAFAVGIALVPEGRRLVEELGLKTSAGVDVHLRAGNSPPTAMGWERLGRATGVRAKLRYLATELVPPADFLRATDPLAAHGTAGLAAAYLVRPFRLAAQAPRGFLAWRRARRRAAVQ